MILLCARVATTWYIDAARELIYRVLVLHRLACRPHTTSDRRVYLRDPRPSSILLTYVILYLNSPGEVMPPSNWCVRGVQLVAQWPRSLRCASVAIRLLGLRVRILPGGMDVCFDCCLLSGRGLCVTPITRSEESYWLSCLWMWSWRIDSEDVLGQWGFHGMEKIKLCSHTETCWLVGWSVTSFY